jgi:hypothetical protein
MKNWLPWLAGALAAILTPGATAAARAGRVATTSGNGST